MNRKPGQWGICVFAHIYVHQSSLCLDCGIIIESLLIENDVCVTNHKRKSIKHFSTKWAAALKENWIDEPAAA